MEAVSEKELAHILRLTALQTDLFTADALDNYSRQVDKMLSGIQDSATEVERLVKQRVGQDLYRKALMDYWDGACAVTGISIPALLRASHAKAWADCDSDAERLNVYNGFLLCAHLDALFDTYLLSFDTEGWSILDSSITTATLASLGLPERFRLRKIAKGHQEFLAWHRRQLINQTRTR
jgi:predicted restriction endonuclease